MPNFEKPLSREEIKQRVLEQFLIEYAAKMQVEPDLYADNADDIIDNLRQGEKIKWDVQGADLLAKISQDFRLSPEEGIALRVQVFEDAKVPTWYKEGAE